MTTADQLAIVNKLLNAPEEAKTLAQAGLVQDWVKSKRLLVVVRRESGFALFVLTSQNFPVATTEDLAINDVLPLDSNFKFDIDSGEKVGPEAVYITVSTAKHKFLFEMLPGYHTQNFVSEMYRITENISNQDSDFSWLSKYTSRLSLDMNSASESQECLASVDGVDGVPRGEVATGMATPIVGRDRESVVNYQMSTKEDQFSDIQNFTFFVGTYNVNGQSPTGNVNDWLAQDEDPPDLYAVGFQELDLSKEAFVFPESVKEDEWIKVVTSSLHPDANYTLVKHIRLVGMMLLVFVKKIHYDHICNIAVDTVGTGIMGKLGNKGGVSIRFAFHSTNVCIVNSHLAAHVEEYERRNQDYHDICSRTLFVHYEKGCADSTLFLGQRRIKDHDCIFWLGDLNYRLNDLDCSEVKDLLEENNLEALQEADQFYHQKHQRKVFVGYEEGDITFLPTYKYDPGTSDWDSSEKSRAPAWTDRILWKGDHIAQTAYRSHMKLKVSDHKPVSAVFRTGMKVIDKIRRQKIKEDIMKKLDMLENDFLPQVTVDTTDIIFDTIKFIEPQTRGLIIANTGQVPVQFAFITKPGEQSYSRPWLTAEPSQGFIMPGAKCDVNLEVYVDKKTAHSLNSGEDKLYDILVLHLMGGKDIFITVTGTYIKSCFGASIDALVHLTVPIGELSPGQVASLESEDSRKGSTEVDGRDDPYPVPKELWFLCDLMSSLGLSQENLFLQPGMRQEILIVRDWLDTGMPVDRPRVSIHSAAESLLIFLESVAQPVVPYTMYERCLESSSNYLQCKQIVSQLPTHHKHVFDYLTAFLREVISHSAQNGIDPKILATLFCGLFLRDPPGTNLGTGLRAKTNQQLLERKKAAFIYHFLVNEPDV